MLIYPIIHNFQIGQPVSFVMISPTTILGLLLYNECLNDLALHYLPDLFVYVYDVHSCITRQTNIGDLFVFNATTAYMQKSLQNSGSLLWNRLPQHIRNATT